MATQFYGPGNPSVSPEQAAGEKWMKKLSIDKGQEGKFYDIINEATSVMMRSVQSGKNVEYDGKNISYLQEADMIEDGILKDSVRKMVMEVVPDNAYIVETYSQNGYDLRS